jgi:hypothetical protein
MGDEKKEDTITVVAGAETLSPLYGFEIIVVPEDKPVEEPPEVAVQEGEVKKGGSKSMLYILGGLLAAGGAAAAVLLGGGGDGNGNGPAPTGSIQVNSNPTGADVYLDGQNTGRTTNTTLTGVSPGTHTIQILKNGYGDHETSVSVSSGQTATVNATLAAHTITVTQPTGSKSYTQGDTLKIRWTTGGGTSQSGLTNVRGGIGSSAHFIRMSRMRARQSALSSRRTDKRFSRNGDMRSNEAIETSSREAAATNNSPTEAGSQGTLNTPRNSSLSRINLMGSTQKVSSSGDVRPQTLDRVRIELFRGDRPERTVAADNENTGRIDYLLSGTLPDASNYKIRVSAVGDSSIRGESPNFTIARLGELRVTSNPTGATIWLDGESQGKTNKTLEVPAGEHKLKLTKERYQDWEKGVTVNVNKTTNVDATLEPGSFTENFNDGKANFYKNYSDYATWSVKNNRYQCSGPHREWARTLYDLGKFENNWTYEAKAQRVAGRAYNVVCLVFGADDKGNVYYILDVSPGEQVWSVWRMDDTGPHQESKVVGWTGSKTIKETGWNDLKIVANGTNFTFYINGELVGSKKINGIPSSGKIGFATYVYSSVGIAAFDDVNFELGQTQGSISGDFISPKGQIPVDSYWKAHIK